MSEHWIAQSCRLYPFAPSSFSCIMIDLSVAIVILVVLLFNLNKKCMSLRGGSCYLHILKLSIYSHQYLITLQHQPPSYSLISLSFIWKAPFGTNHNESVGDAFWSLCSLHLFLKDSFAGYHIFMFLLAVLLPDLLCAPLCVCISFPTLRSSLHNYHWELDLNKSWGR